MAWIGTVDSETRMVRSAASYGEGIDYLKDIQISADAGSALGRGPTGLAIREDRPYWCQDFMSDPATAPWSERAAKVGWAASAALPLHRKGEVVGARTLYSGEINSFDPSVRDLLSEMAVDISFTLDNFAHEMARRQSEAALRTSLTEKEILLKEVHHRVKNNMQVISSLLNLQSSAIEDERVRTLFQESQNRVRSMALVHELLYQSENLARIDLAVYARMLAESLWAPCGADASAVALKLELVPVFLDVDAAVPTGLIINELLSNAMKHAFLPGRRGTITLKVGPHGDGAYWFSVSDDGVGMPASMDIHNTATLGLQLVSTLCTQLEATITLDSQCGARFTVVAPAK